MFQHNRERRLRPEEIDLLKKTVAKGTNDEEFLFFMTVCRKHRVDPFTKQIYCVVWPTNQGQSHEVVIIMGIGGYRMTAARDHKDFAGTSKAIYTWFDPPQKTNAKRRIPESATVRALRKGGIEPSEAEAFWEEFAPADLSAKRSDFWNRMPKHMLAKCAEALAIRKAFPDLSDIYTEEEVSQRLQDYTEGGRAISVGGVAPSGKVLEGNSYDAAKAAQQKILDDKLAHGHPQGSEGAKNAEAALKRVEAEDAKLKTPDGGSKGIIEIDHTNPKEPIIRGDVYELLDILQKECVMLRYDDWWHISAKSVEKAKEICLKAGFRVAEYNPNQKASGKQEAKPDTKATSGSANAGAKQSSAAPTVVTGNLVNTIMGMSKNKTPMVNAKIGKTWLMCFKNTIFDYLTQNIGRDIAVLCDARMQIVGIKRIGLTEFEDDGKTPIVKKDRDAGTPSMFK